MWSRRTQWESNCALYPLQSISLHEMLYQARQRWKPDMHAILQYRQSGEKEKTEMKSKIIKGWVIPAQDGTEFECDKSFVSCLGVDDIETLSLKIYKTKRQAEIDTARHYAVAPVLIKIGVQK